MKFGIDKNERHIRVLKWNRAPLWVLITLISHLYLDDCPRHEFTGFCLYRLKLNHLSISATRFLTQQSTLPAHKQPDPIKYSGNRAGRFGSLKIRFRFGSAVRTVKISGFFSDGSKVSHRPSSHGVHHITNSRPAFPTNRHNDIWWRLEVVRLEISAVRSNTIGQRIKTSL